MKPSRYSAINSARVLLWWLACVLVSHAQAQVFHDRFLAFGTLVEISIDTDDAALAREAFRVLEDDFAEWHRNWHAWNPGDLQRVNRMLAGGGWTAAHDLIPLIERAKTLSRASRGLFNPAIGRLVELWGFHGGGDRNRWPPPAESVARLLRQAPSMDDVEIKGARVRSDNPAVLLDFGGFAKGYGIDRAIETLRATGITNAIVNAGGDLRAIGRRGQRPWGIGIRHPRREGLIAWLEIGGGEAVFTSGDYERFFEYKNKRYQHIIDPRDGYPVAETVSVTVIHPQADLADAAATALLVAGADEWVEIARAMGVDQAMLIDARGRIYISPELAERIDFVGVPAPKITIERGFQNMRRVH